MKKSFLHEYREIEEKRGIEIAENLLRDDFTISNARAIYPEYELGTNFALHRPGVNLGAMLFLFPRVIVYVPPIPPDKFAIRYGIDYEAFLELAFPSDEQDRFIYPVLNHPRYYANPEIRSGLKEILIRQPPTWERWHAALRATGGIYWFNESDQLFNYKNIWNITEHREYWKKKLNTRSNAWISREIKQQLRNNYTDLCLVGRTKEAREIAKQSHNDPYLALADLYYSSDTYAYPEVMGAGGCANFVCLDDNRMYMFLNRSKEAGLPFDLGFDTEVVEAMLEGLNFHNIPSIFRAEFLRKFHRSEQANLVRQAYWRLVEEAQKREPHLKDIHLAMKTILRYLKDFCDSSESSSSHTKLVAEERQRRLVYLAALGGILTCFAGFYAPPQLTFISGLIWSILGVYKFPTRKRVEKALLKKHCPQVPYELFRDYRSVIEYRENLSRIGIPKGLPQKIQMTDVSASSIPVRTLWWKNPEKT